MELTKGSEFFYEREVRNSDVDLLRDGLVLREHGQDDALRGLVENGQHLRRGFREEVGEDLGFGGQDVVVDLEAGPVLLAHLPDALAVEVVAAAVDVSSEEVSEAVENFGARSGHADVLADRAASGVLQVLDGLEHVDPVLFVDVEATVGGTFSGQATFPARRFIVVVV
jgi:hypothetical protein